MIYVLYGNQPKQDGFTMNIFDLNALKSQEADDAYNKHEAMVSEYLSLLERGYCLQIGASYGKDSSSILNGALDAMKRAVKLKIIDRDHPIVIITVDTLQEPEPIQCYVPYAQKAVREFAKNNDINAIVETVSPPIYQELMILYSGAQKLPASSMSGRHADCSVIWKVDTGIAALKRIKGGLSDKYQNSVWISASGSRSSESTRRNLNMQKQGVKNYKSADLIKNIQASQKTGKKGGVFKFAPIEDWQDHEVINYLLHAGENPIMPSMVGKRVPAYGENFGLLIAIYGEGSNDTCEVVSIDSENKAEQKGCGKIARFGCVTCLQTSADHSAIEIKKGVRWSRFGDSTQRFRDFLMRISVDVKYRAFHARAFDPACNNNVFLQPNVLKAKVLEKMVWYASQITVDSTAIYHEALKAQNEGTIDQDVGVLDIMSDSSLSNSVKMQYKEMYIARLTEKPMFEMFTQKHAVLLSLMWALHGVSTLPYRPVAILDAVKKGKRIPYPLTNKEINAKNAALGMMSWDHKSNMVRSIPDALVAQVFKPASKSFETLLATHKETLNESHLSMFMPFEISDFWEKKNIQFDALGASYNHVTTSAKEKRRFKLTYTIDNDTANETIKAVDAVTGKNIPLKNNPELYKELLSLGRSDFSMELDRTDDLEMLYGPGVQSVTKNHEFNHQKTFTSDLYFSSSQLRKKKEPTRNFSARKRAYDQKAGTIVPGRSSLKVYRPTITPALEEQAKQTVSYWVPEFTKTRNASIDIHDDYLLDDCDIKQSFVFDDVVFDLWMSQGGWERLVCDHNLSLNSRIQQRKPVRLFSGTNPVYYLTTNTGLTITEHFNDYMLKTLKRTEVFDQAGLYSIANLPYEKIKQIPFVINMTEHRKQKVQHLLAVRFLKNKRRNIIKSSIANGVSAPKKQLLQAVSNVSVRMQEFAEQYIQIANLYLVASAFGEMTDGPQKRKKSLSIWLHEFNNVMVDIEDALQLLSTKDELELINNDFDTKLSLTKLHSKNTSRIISEVKAFAQSGLNKTKSLESALGDDIVVTDGHYEAVGDTSKKIASIAKWIVSNYKGANQYLVECGFVQNIAYQNKLPYVCPVINNNENSNTPEKLAKRCMKANNKVNAFSLALDMNKNLFSQLFSAVNHQSQARKSVATMSQKAKADKLRALMAA